MTLQRHIFTKPGRSNTTTGLISRLFGVCKRILNPKTKSDSRKEPQFQLTNAEYHLNSNEIQRLIDAGSNPRDTAIIRLLADTGIRRAELCNLSYGDIRWREGQIIIRSGKGKKMRLVPMAAELANALRIVLAGRQTGPVFVSRQGGRLSIRQVNRVVADIGVRADVANPNPKYQHVTPHLLRHSFARLWKDCGGSIEALSKIMGHTSTNTTWDLYGTMSLNDVQKEYRRIFKKAKSINKNEEPPFTGKE
jgi:integrase